MKKLLLFLALAIATPIFAQNIPAAVQRKTDGTNDLTTPVAVPSGGSLTIRAGGTFNWVNGATFGGSASAFRTAIGAGTSDFDGAFASLTGKPTTLAGYGITDPVVVTSTSYSNPSWITALAWSKLTGTPTTLAGYGITDPVVTTAGSYANPAWITSLAGSKLTGAYTAGGQTMATARILGRTTASTGAAEELTASGVLDIIGTTRGSVLYRGASGWTILAPGTNGYVLTSSGAGGDPSWAVGGGGGGGVWGSITGTLSNQTDLQTALDAKQPLAAKLTALAAMTWGTNTILYSPTSSTVAPITTGNSGVLITSSGGVPSISSDLPTAVTIGAGYIYRVGGTTVAVTDGGTGIAAGTSGGIPYFSGATSIASSALLGANQIVLGGGAATAPSTLGALGTTVQVLHGNAAGAPSWGALSLTADVSGILPGANGGTGNGFTAFTGPASSLKTFTLPNGSAAILTDAAAVTVAQGGTGITSGTSGGVPYFSSGSTIASSAALTASRLVLGGGAGAAPTVLGAGTSTTLLHGNASGAPTFSAVSLTADVTGSLPIANGGTGAATKAAGFDALSPMTTSGDIIYGGVSGTGTRLPKGSDGQVLTLASGLPSWSSSAAGTVTTTGTMTATAIVTSNGSAVIQTPNASTTIDSSGNVSTPGTYTAGAGGSVGGGITYFAGTLPSTTANGITISAPAAVTAYNEVRPGTAGSGFYYGTNSAGVVTVTQISANGSGNVILASGAAITSPTITTGITPTSNDGAALGSTSLNFSDLFLATGAVINFNNGNYTLTHSSGALTASGSFSIGTSNALTAGTIELGAASDTTLSRSAAGVLAVEGVVIPSISSTNALTNKRVTARITTITSSATPTVNTDNCDCVNITALAAAITSMTSSLTGTPVDFDQLEFRIKDNGTARAITWGASFVAGPTALPTTTVLSKCLHVWFEYDAVQTKWVCISSGSDA